MSIRLNKDIAEKGAMMALAIINESTLTNIADSVRLKLSS